MIKLILFLVCVFVAIKVINIVWASFSIGLKKEKAYKMFLKTDKLIKSECHLIYQAIPALSDLTGNDKETTSNIANIISNLSKLDDSYENIDRKIALYEIMSEKFEKVIHEVVENSPNIVDKNLIELINQYNDMQSEIDSAKRVYNKSALCLRKGTDIFPSSYFARMQKIFPVDTYKI